MYVLNVIISLDTFGNTFNKGLFMFVSRSYLFSMAVLTTVYMAVQVGFKGHELRTKKDVIPPKVSVWIDYSGDQVYIFLFLSPACPTFVF